MQVACPGATGGKLPVAPPPCGRLTLTPGRKGLVNRVLNLIASKMCLTIEAVHKFFGLTYVSFQHKGESGGAVRGERQDACCPGPWTTNPYK
jgi:hypothetical protein